jgi:hypothetical protein
MRHTGICATLIISFLLIVYPSIGLSEENHIIILKYSFKPVAYEKSGSLVKTRWDLNLINEGERSVKFIVRILLIDKDNNKLDEIKKKCEIDAGEIKRFSDSALIEEPMAKRITLTRVYIDETDK